MRKVLDAHQVVTTLKALSKWPDKQVCAVAASALAGRLADEPQLPKDLDRQGVVIALNALSKWPDTAVCAEAVNALAERLVDEPDLRKELGPVDVTNVLTP